MQRSNLFIYSFIYGTDIFELLGTPHFTYISLNSYNPTNITILEMRLLHLERLNKLLKLAGKNLKFRPKVRSVYRPSQVRSALCLCPLDPTRSEKVIHTPLEPRWGQKADRLISNPPGQRFFRADTCL